MSVGQEVGAAVRWEEKLKLGDGIEWYESYRPGGARLHRVGEVNCSRFTPPSRTSLTTMAWTVPGSQFNLFN